MPSISTITCFKVGPQPDSAFGGESGHFSKWPPHQFLRGVVCRLLLKIET